MPATFRAYFSAASSADGTRLIVGSGIGFVLTSTNSGATWQTNPLPSAIWESVASSADGTKLAAAINNGIIYTSTNSGTTWVSNNVPNAVWRSVAMSADGTRLAGVAAGIGSAGGHIYTSTDSGATWISNNVPAPLSYNSVAMSADGGRMATGSSPGGSIFTSFSPVTPQLNLANSNNAFVLSWTVPSTNFALQSSSDLSGMNWVTLTNTPTFDLNSLQDVISFSPTNSSGFFRLVTP